MPMREPPEDTGAERAVGGREEVRSSREMGSGSAAVGATATGQDPAALCAALYERHIDFVVGFLQKMGFSREDAKDLAQETFLRVYKGMGEYRGGAERAFLAKIAKRVALNWVRKQQAKKRGLEVPLADPSTLESVPLVDIFTGRGPRNPEEQMQLREFKSLLAAAILDLPAPSRIPVLMRIPGNSYHEIAVALGLSEEAVKSALRDARRTLHRKLGKDPTGIGWPQPLEGGRE